MNTANDLPNDLPHTATGHPEPPPHDPMVQRMELIISYLLRAGVLISLGVVLVGTIITFTHHPDYLKSSDPLSRLTHPGHAAISDFDSLINGIAHGRGQAIVALGLVLLIVTPVFRVAVSVFAFMFQRDRVFVWITSAVLLLLILSVVLGKVE